MNRHPPISTLFPHPPLSLPPPPPPPLAPAPESLEAADGEEDRNEKPPLAGAAFELAEQSETARQCPYCGERSEEHTSELQSLAYLVCRLLLEKKKKNRDNRV